MYNCFALDKKAVLHNIENKKRILNRTRKLYSIVSSIVMARASRPPSTKTSSYFKDRMTDE